MTRQRPNTLTLDSLKVPELQEKTASHMPGGGVLGLEVGMNFIEALSPTFKLSGFDPQTLTLFGLGTPHRHVYTGYGVVRDKKTGRALEAKTIIEARMTAIKPDEFKRGDMYGHDHELSEGHALRTAFRRQRKVLFRFLDPTPSAVNGTDHNADTNRILRIG